MSIQFTDVCFITEDVLRLRAFYETVFDVTAEGNEVHSTLIAGGVTFTFDYVAPLQENSVFHYVSAGGANNVIIGFNVDDVDAEYKRLLSLGVALDVLMNWGNGKYIELPDKWDIHEYSIMEAFCGSLSNERISNALYSIIQGRGAFRRFKDTICRYGVEDTWYRFRDEAFKKLAIEWCEHNNILYM